MKNSYLKDFCTVGGPCMRIPNKTWNNLRSCYLSPFRTFLKRILHLDTNCHGELAIFMYEKCQQGTQFYLITEFMSSILIVPAGYILNDSLIGNKSIKRLLRLFTEFFIAFILKSFFMLTWYFLITISWGHCNKSL